MGEGKVHVLVVSKLDLHQDYLKEIAAVSRTISVEDVTGQVIAELRRKGRQGFRIDLLEKGTFLGRDRFSFAPQSSGTKENMDTLLARAEVIFGQVLVPDDLASRAPKLKWLHWGGAGIDPTDLPPSIFESDIIITNSRGVHAVPIAEHALAFMFMLAKNNQRMLNNQQDMRWERYINLELRDRVASIIGLGAIGGELARLARCLGMKVIGTKKSATRRESNVSGVDELYPGSELPQMLSQSDFVVVAAPLTDETRGMIGEKEIRAMKPTAYFINIARGEIVDESALIKALKEGRIAGAGLDVFETEPPPRDSELWRLPNVIMSNHMAGATDRRSHRLIEMFCENLRRYLTGEPLLNVIDKHKGY